MNKEEQIEIKKSKPIEVGDVVRISIPYTDTILETIKKGRKKEFINKEVEKIFEVEGSVLEIVDGFYKVNTTSHSIPAKLHSSHGYTNLDSWILVKPDFVSPTFHECGSDPFAEENYRIGFYNQTINSLISKAGYDSYKSPIVLDEKDKDWRKINFNPYVIDENGVKQYYQRGLIWTLEEKQSLIESIYNGIEIGKFLFRYNSWNRMEKEFLETGERHSWDCVDGKQRLNTIIEFMTNKFPDSHGNYYSDLSTKAQRKFRSYSNLSYGELGEDARDKDVINNFLTLNFTGVPMSKEHIEYVKSIKIK